MNVERWLAKVAETDRLCTQVFAEAKKCLENGIIQVKDPKFVSPITDVLVSELEKHFGGLDPLYGYASFHPLIGSTPVFDFTPDFDLPGGEIVQFTKDLLERLQRANETGVFES